MDDCYDSDSALSDAPSSAYSDGQAEGDAGKPKDASAKFRVIDKTSLVAAQTRDLDQVRDVLGVTMHQARTLLIHFRWNVENLFGYLADVGHDELFRKVGLLSRTDDTSSAGTSGTVTCMVCFSDVPKAESSTMEDCSHTFCNDCWTQHFLIKIKEGQSRRITCMTPKCGAICHEEVVSRLVGQVDTEAAEKYENCLLESYIEDNAKAKWCPSVPHCGHAIQVDGEPYVEPECVCGQRFCFNCGSVPHSPCSCRMWQLWEQKCNDESETNNWITAHTKPCPKCGKLVEKNGGCNLVGCPCGQAFCWLCGAATGRDHTWTAIAGHSCGRYKEDKDREIERAAQDLHRYIHYHSRWKAHMDSQKLETTKLGEVEKKVEEMENEREAVLNDYSWLSAGIAQLLLARSVLAYSYPFAFYMFGNDMFAEEITPSQNLINQNLFEDQQQELEGTVEKLSHLLSTEPRLMTEDVRMDVVNLTALTNTRCARVYDVVENDLLSHLQLSTQHIAPYNTRLLNRQPATAAKGGVALTTAGEDAAAAKGKRAMEGSAPQIWPLAAGGAWGAAGAESPSKRLRQGGQGGPP